MITSFKVRDFLKNEQGSFLILFGLLGAIFIFAGGMGIDYARAVNEQRKLQTAIDAAVLAGSSVGLNPDPSISANDLDAAIRDAALDAFNVNYQPENGAFNLAPSFTYDPATRDVTGTVTAQVSTTFTRLFNINEIDIASNARGSTIVPQLEFVLAIDQSGSMRWPIAGGPDTRQDVLETALNSFADIVFDGALSRSEVFVGIVPWQTTVNIGTQRVDWLQGINPGVMAGFDDETPITEVINELADLDYEGNGYDGFNPSRNFMRNLFDRPLLDRGFSDPNDGVPFGQRRNMSFAIPGFSSVETFTPTAGSDPYAAFRWRGCVLERGNTNTIRVNSGDNVSNFLTPDPNNAADQSVLDRPTGVDRFHIYYNPPGWGQGTNDNLGTRDILDLDGDGRTNDFVAIGVPDIRSGDYRDWVSDDFVNDWYPFGTAFETEARGPIGEDDDRERQPERGPNLGCIRQPVTYLSNDPSTLRNEIDALLPEDDTTAHTDASLGMLWALRMLDPDWGDDWNSGRPAGLPSDFGGDPLDTNKVIVLLTDGVNGITQGTIPQSWTAYGNTSDRLASNNDLRDDAQTARVLNVRTLKLCQLARNLGVAVYTIAFDLPDIPDNTLARNTMKFCATQPSFFLDAQNQGQLLAAFEFIAQQNQRVVLSQ